MIVLAVDPGARNTGLVLREGDTLLGWELVVRQSKDRLPDGPYLRSVLGGCLKLLRTANVAPTVDRDRYIVGVETVRWWPQGGRGPGRNQNHLYGTAMVLAAVLTRWPDATVVDSGRGVANLHRQAYPREIRQPVGGAGKDRLKDVRAAWDHSHAAQTLWRRGQG